MGNGPFDYREYRLEYGFFALQCSYHVSIQRSTAEIDISYRVGELSEPVVPIFKLRSGIKAVRVLEKDRSGAAITRFWPSDQRMPILSSRGLYEHNATVGIIVEPCLLSLNFGGIHHSLDPCRIIRSQGTFKDVERVSVYINDDGLTAYFVLENVTKQTDARILVWGY
jgi:hypothetical protein